MTTTRPPHAQPVPPRAAPRAARRARPVPLSQAELAEKIGSDARQVSRYETGRVAPSLEAGVRVAGTFNTSVGYLVTPPDAPRQPLHAPHNALGARLADLGQLTSDERATILAVIDAITTKAKLGLTVGGAS